jgi:hypothetical protein
VFDGTNDYTQISQNGINVGVTFTVQCWVKVIRFGGFAPGWNRGSIITNAYPYSNNAGFWICCTSQASNFSPTVGQETFFISIGQDQHGATAVRGSLSSYVDKWVNLSVRVNGTELIKLYINGLEVEYLSQQNGPSSLSYSTDPCSLGIRGTNDEEPLHGSISLIMMYNRALSASEVLQNYNATKSRFGL